MSELSVQELILDQLKTLTEKVDYCTVSVSRVQERVDAHAVAQTREHGEVQRRVGQLEIKTQALSESTATMKVKMAAYGAIVGAVVSEALRRLFHT